MGVFVADIPFQPITNSSAFQPSSKDVRLQTVVGITCCLSIIGSTLIIISYLVQKKHTKAREILAHISLMDLGTSLANLIGLIVNFDHFYRYEEPPVYIENICKTQAFFAAYCTLGSVFWTTALAAYLYIIIYNKDKMYSLYFVRFCYVFCYGLAIGVSLWLVFTQRLGYSPYFASGWCSLKVEKDNTKFFTIIFSHDLWMYLSIILITIFYVAIRVHLSNQVVVYKDSHKKSTKKLWSSVDYKFILIPLTFILLRVWSCIMIFLLEYISLDDTHNKNAWKFLTYIAGIGDSGQGFTNAILFILFTKSVRNRFMRLVCYKKRPASRLEEVTTSSDEESPALLKDPGKEITPLLEGNKAVGQSPFQATMGEVSVNVDVHT